MRLVPEAFGFVFRDLKTNQSHTIHISLRVYQSNYGDRILGDMVKRLAKKLRVPLKGLRLEGYGRIRKKKDFEKEKAKVVR